MVTQIMSNNRFFMIFVIFCLFLRPSVRILEHALPGRLMMGPETVYKWYLPATTCSDSLKTCPKSGQKVIFLTILTIFVTSEFVWRGHVFVKK